MNANNTTDTPALVIEQNHTGRQALGRCISLLMLMLTWGSAWAQDEPFPCPVDGVTSAFGREEPACEDCRPATIDVKLYNSSLRSIEQRVTEEVAIYNQLCTQVVECEESESDSETMCPAGKKVSLSLGYSGENSGTTWAVERWMADVDENFDSFEDLLDKVSEHVPPPLDKTAECGNCLSYLRIFQHATEAGKYGFGDVWFTADEVDAATGNFKEPGNNRALQSMFAKLDRLKPYLCEDAEIAFIECDIATGDEGELTGQAIANYLDATVLAPDFSASLGGCPTAESPSYWADSGTYKVFPAASILQCEARKAAHKKAVTRQWYRVKALKNSHHRMQLIVNRYAGFLEDCERQRCNKPTTGDKEVGQVDSTLTVPADSGVALANNPFPGLLITTESTKWCDFGIGEPFWQPWPTVTTEQSDTRNIFTALIMYEALLSLQELFGEDRGELVDFETMLSSWRTFSGVLSEEELIYYRHFEREAFADILFPPITLDEWEPTRQLLNELIELLEVFMELEEEASDILEIGQLLVSYQEQLDGLSGPVMIESNPGAALGLSASSTMEPEEHGAGQPTSTTDPTPADNTTVIEPMVQLFVKAKRSVLRSDGSTATEPAPAQQVKVLFPPGALPEVGVAGSQVGHDQEPAQGTTDSEGEVAIDFFTLERLQEFFSSLEPQVNDPDEKFDMFIPAVPVKSSELPQPPRWIYPQDAFGNAVQIEHDIVIDAEPQESYVIQGEAGTSTTDLIQLFPTSLSDRVVQQFELDGIPFVTIMHDDLDNEQFTPLIGNLELIDGVFVEPNICRTKQELNDPLFGNAGNAARPGSWGQPYDDQWAIKRVGFTNDSDSAWELTGAAASPVIVAVIDTGLDWNHLDFAHDNLWRNSKEIANNQRDDDGNGYVDDVIGWNFLSKTNSPWDYDGHGTTVAGIIAATQDNGIGIAGINPHARIMVLKALNEFGNTRASFVAEAIVYAVDNGARIINLSVGGPQVTRVEQAAVEYALAKGVLIVSAAGNEGESLSEYGINSIPGVLTVAATGRDDQRTVFSNWGSQVDIAAPGIDVLSLRARRTDTMRDIPDVQYENGANYVGDDKRYYRVSGTSFAAPIVTGIASLVVSGNADITLDELRRVLVHSATDTDIPGKDQFSGYGIVNAKAALNADPAFFIDALITGASVVTADGKAALQVTGSADALHFRRAWLEIGAGKQPNNWKRVIADIGSAVRDDVIGTIDATQFGGNTLWMIKLVTEDHSGQRREFWFQLTLG